MKHELDSLVTLMHAGGLHYDEAVQEFKRRFILEVLSHHRGNQCKAARELSMHRNTLRRTIAELRLDPEQIRSGLKRPPRGEHPVFEGKQTAQRGRALCDAPQNSLGEMAVSFCQLTQGVRK